jgi:SAM-dependent methyltransferase
LRTFDSILDWGCGCGRLTRHLAALAGSRITGADIDADNLAWCRDHVPGARFEPLPLSPPSALGASRFDLVIGLSVMTHLREADQLAWLEELDRIAAPGAFLLLTINADTAIWWSDPSAELLEKWRERGFLDGSRDNSLNGVIADDTYYRATFHRADYVERVWGERFEVIEILPAFSHIQDLVVLRKR